MQSSVMNSDASGSTGDANLEHAAVEWLRTELEDPEITGYDNFLDIGGHSLAFSRLNKFLGETFGVVLDMKVAYEEPLSSAAAKAQLARTSASPK